MHLNLCGFGIIENRLISLSIAQRIKIIYLQTHNQYVEGKFWFMVACFDFVSIASSLEYDLLFKHFGN